MKKITFSTHYLIPSSHLNGISCVKSKQRHQRQILGFLVNLNYQKMALKRTLKPKLKIPFRYYKMMTRVTV